MTLQEQLLLNSQPILRRVEIYSPPLEEEAPVIQEENTDPTPG
jgi:hypothetical protein